MRRCGALIAIRFCRALVAGVILWGLAFALPAGAETRPAAPTHRELTTPPLVAPEPLLPTKPIEGLRAPSMPSPPAKADSLSAADRIEVRSFDLRGNTVFTHEQLQPLLARYAGRPVSYEDLEELRYALTRLYVDAGYVSSGAVLPDQEVLDGIVRIDIVEGRLVDVKVTGAEHFSPDYLRRWVLAVVDEPVNIHQLEESLQLFTSDRRVRRINAELEPTARLGESVLRLRVEDRSPFRAQAQLDNWTETSVGEAGGTVTLSYDNLFGRAQELAVYSGATEGSTDVGARYELPIPVLGLVAEAFGEYSANSVVEAPFSQLDIESESHTYGLGLTWMVHETVAERHAVQIGIDHTKTVSSLLGVDFSFVPGAHNGETTVTPLRFAFETRWRNASTAFAGRLRLSQGTDLLGATENPDKRPDAEFTAFLARLQLLRRVSSIGSILVRVDGQYSTRALFPSEQLVAGGHDSVRGYPESYATGDNGVIGSVEFQVPLRRSPSGETLVESHLFFDTATVDLIGRAEPGPSTLVSIGVGLRGRLGDFLETIVDVGIPMLDAAPDTGSAQDFGIHLGITGDLRPLERFAVGGR